MKIVGAATVRAPAEEVWAALRDPEVLARCIPGCDGFEVTAPGQARFTTTTAMTAVAGTYAGTLSITDQQPPSVIVAAATAAGDRGAVNADLTLRLTPDDSAGTLVSYEASGEADGEIAGVGARLLASAGKRMAEEFLAAVDAVLADRRDRQVSPETQAGEDADAGQAAARRISDAVVLAGRKEVKIAFAVGALAGLAVVIVRVLTASRRRRSSARGRRSSAGAHHE
jgi:uncharacterized protein